MKSEKVNLNKNITPLKENLFNIYEATGIENTLEFYQELLVEIDNKKGNKDYVELELKEFIEELIKLKNYNEAEKAVLVSLKHFQENPQFHYQYACILVKQDRKEKAAFYLEEACRKDKATLTLIKNAAVKLLEMRYFSSATNIIHTYVKSKPALNK